MTDVRKLVIEARKEQKLSRNQVAAKTGLHFNTIADFERGKTKMGRLNLLVLTEALGISPERAGLKPLPITRRPPGPLESVTTSLVRFANLDQGRQDEIVASLSATEVAKIAEAFLRRVTAAADEFAERAPRAKAGASREQYGGK